MVFFCFLIWGFFFHFIALGLSPSGLGYEGIFCFLIWGFFFHFIAFGLSPSGLGYDGFLLCFVLGLPFPFYCLWLSPSALGSVPVPGITHIFFNVFHRFFSSFFVFVFMVTAVKTIHSHAVSTCTLRGLFSDTSYMPGQSTHHFNFLQDAK